MSVCRAPRASSDRNGNSVTTSALGLAPHEQAEMHLHALFDGELDAGEWYELRCLDCSTEPAGKGPRSFYRSITSLTDEAMRLAERWDVFFGVGLRRCPTTVDIRSCPHDVKGLDHVSRLPAAWSDMDVRCDEEPDKPHESTERAQSLALSMRPAPTIIVGSGVGIHAYWKISPPTSDLQRIVALNKAIRERVQGDNAIDPARILRLAGTLNHKHGSPLPVELLHCKET